MKAPDIDIHQELKELKQELADLKDSVARRAARLDEEDMRRFLATEAERVGFDRDIDLDALRAEGDRAVRMIRRHPGTTVGLAAALGFCTGLMIARR
jgi:ElaB/YqjD/DUF883 family membrane-anchored ribosome-binding protein